jgi:hypothetical protein
MVPEPRRVTVPAVVLLVLVVGALAGALPSTGTVAHPAAPWTGTRFAGAPVSALDPAIRPATNATGWSLVAAVNGPPAMGGSTMATYPSADGVILFGGNSGSLIYNTTWQYNASGWTNLTATAPGPSARSGSEMAWDPSEDGVLLYGGIGPTGNTFLDDTWLFQGGVWTNLTASAGTGPGPLGAGVMALDPGTGDPILFGGAYAGGGSFSHATWQFANGTWHDISSTAGIAPDQRVFFGFTADPAIGGLVLYGGQRPDGSVDSDTWTFAHGMWTNVTANESTSPGPLRSMALAYDAAYGAPILWGGDVTGTGNPTNATWAFSTSGRWVNLTGEFGTAPSGRWSTMASPDPAGGVLLFGGCQALGCSVAVNDTWRFQAFPPAPDLRLGTAYVRLGTEETFSASAEGGVAPYTFSYAFGDSAVVGRTRDATLHHAYLGALTYTATLLAWDSVGSMAGSENVTVHVTAPGASPSLWSPAATTVSPSPRGGAAIAYDTALGSELLFGGTSAGGGVLGDTWTYGATGWVNVTSAGSSAPSARSGAVAWYDANLSAVVLYGGVGPTGAIDTDTWEFDGGWSNVTSSVGVAPAARTGEAVAFDPASGEGVLFGGLNATGSVLADTWTFTPAGWTHLAITTPTGRTGASLAPDAAEPGLVLFGGTDCGGSPCSDTWRFSAGIWTLATPIGPSPPSRFGAAFGDDATYGAAFLFGGDSATTGLPRNDTWGWNGSAWSNVTSNVGPAPSPRAQTGLVPAPSGSGLWTAAGCAAAGCASAEQDTWTLAPVPLVVNATTVTAATAAPTNSTVTPTVVGGIGIASLSYDFGDGSFTNTTELSAVTHEYRAAGTYHASLTAVDATGQRSTVTWTVTLAAATSGGGGHSGNGNNSTGKKNGTTPIPPAPPPRSFWQGEVLYLVVGAGVVLALLIVAIAVMRWRARSRPPRASALPPTVPASSPPGSISPPAPPSEPVSVRSSLVLPADPAPMPQAPPEVPASAVALGPAAEASGGPDLGAEGGSLGDRILVHLLRQGRLASDALAPQSVTQSGLSEALGRPQSAFARTLQRLESSGLVFTELRHVQGAPRRLKVYRLTGTGEAKALELRRRASEPARPKGTE